MFLSKWLRQGAEIESLRTRLSSKESDLATERWRVEQLEKQVEKQTKRADKAMTDYANACGKLVGQKPMFSEVHEKKEVHHIDDNYTDSENAKFEFMAEEMRKADIENGVDAPDLQTYVNIIKGNPTAYHF